MLKIINHQPRRSALLPEEIDQLDIPVLPKVPLELVLVKRLKVLNVAHVYVPCCTRMHSKCEARLQRTGILAPTDFQPTVIQSETLVGRHLEERERSCWIDKGNELPRHKH